MIRRTLAVLLVLAAPLAAQGPTVRLSLEDALRRVDSSSAAVAIARAGLTRAGADLLRARSARLPQLSGSATYSRTLASQFSSLQTSSDSGGETTDTFPDPTNCKRYVPRPELSVAQRLDSLERGLDCAANGSAIDFSKLPFGRKNTWNFGLSGSQTLWDPKIGGRIGAAKAGQDAADIGLTAERTAAVLEAAQGYYDAQLAERLLEIADSSLAQAERTLAQTTLAKNVGDAAEFDLLRATVARDNQRPVVIQRRAQRDQALLRLVQLLRLPAGATVVLTTPLGDTTAATLPAFAAAVASANDTSVMHRAPVLQAEAGVRASQGLLDAARGSYLPSLTVSSQFARIAFPDKVFDFTNMVSDWSVNLRLDVPIFTGGRTRADVLTAQANRAEAEARLRQARDQAGREQQDATNQLAAAEAAWNASLGTTEQATRAYAIAEVRFQNGISTLTELGDARLLLQQAQANRAQAARDLQVARVRAALLRDLPFGAGMTVPGSF